MSGPAYVLPTISSRKLGAVFANESATGSNSKGKEREGSLAATLTPSTLDFGGKIKLIDVVKDYTWTLSQLTPDDIEEVPYIQLQEFKVVDGSIKRQFQFYANSYLPDAASDAVPIFLKRPSDSNTSVLDAYKDIWPTDDPTGFSYKFPYFNKVGYELGTEQWQDIQPIGDSVKQLAGGFGETAGKLVGNVIDLAANVSNGIMNYQYPAVGVTDRPRTFVGHNDRTITISFTLYNTLRDVDWKDNRDLVYMLMSQNLFNKRDSTTGVPPVFYSVHIPGQYFCYAACATNYKVEYLGNQRLLQYDSKQYIVPDAYQIDITLTEMVKPSKNQLEAMTTGEAVNRVSVTTTDRPKEKKKVGNFINYLNTSGTGAPQVVV